MCRRWSWRNQPVVNRSVGTGCCARRVRHDWLVDGGHWEDAVVKFVEMDVGIFQVFQTLRPPNMLVISTGTVACPRHLLGQDSSNSIYTTAT